MLTTIANILENILENTVENISENILENVFDADPSYSKIILEIIATGKTLQAVTPFHYFNFYHWITFISR